MSDRTPRLLDLGFVAALLLTAAVPLVWLRGSPLQFRAEGLGGSAALLTIMVALWAFLARRAGGVRVPAEAVSRGRDEGDNRSPWWRTTLIAGLLGGVALAGFYRPLRIHFWGGGDDFLNFLDTPLLTSMAEWNASMNRPLTALPTAIGAALSPHRVEGFLWLGAGLCWVNALLLYAVLRELLPRWRVLPVVAPVLLIVDRSEPSRFFVLWTTMFYWTALALLLLGTWLFLLSYRRGSRPLLALACLSLAASLLTNESGYPLAVLPPVLAWFGREQRRRLPVWTCAWVGTLALVSLRFLVFLSHQGGDTYQTQQVAAALRHPALLWGNLLLHLKAGLVNFQTTGALAASWGVAATVLALVAALVGVAAWRAEEAPARRCWGVVLGVAAVALLLGTLPAMRLQGVFRTQFFSAPGQAVLLAGVFCLAGKLLGRRAGVAVVAAAVGLVAANAASESIARQRLARAESPVSFERTVHIFQQIHAVCPKPPPGTLMLLFLEDLGSPPFACNYCGTFLARRCLGAWLVPGNYVDPTPLPMIPVYRANSVAMKEGLSVGFKGAVGYDKVLAFRLSADNTITLLWQLPARLLPRNHSADRYNPLALLRPGPVAELDYLRYPPATHRPCDLFPMKDGVLLGCGWGRLESHEGKVTRQVCESGELVVNSFGRDRRELRLEVAPGPAERLEALDEKDRVVATAELRGGRAVHLALPTDADRAGVFRLRACDGAGAAVPFRACCAGGTLAHFQRRPADVVAAPLALGEQWYPLETCEGVTFRWVANDAEIVAEARLTPPGAVVVDVEPGPSLGGQPCRLTLRDQAGRVLAAARVDGRKEIRLAVPCPLEADTVLRLHVEGGGLELPGNPRILNFRIFRCVWQAP